MVPTTLLLLILSTLATPVIAQGQAAHATKEALLAIQSKMKATKASREAEAVQEAGPAAGTAAALEQVKRVLRHHVFVAKPKAPCSTCLGAAAPSRPEPEIFFKVEFVNGSKSERMLSLDEIAGSKALAAYVRTKVGRPIADAVARFEPPRMPGDETGGGGARAGDGGTGQPERTVAVGVSPTGAQEAAPPEGQSWAYVPADSEATVEGPQQGAGGRQQRLFTPSSGSRSDGRLRYYATVPCASNSYDELLTRLPALPAALPAAPSGAARPVPLQRSPLFAAPPSPPPRGPCFRAVIDDALSTKEVAVLLDVRRL